MRTIVVAVAFIIAVASGPHAAAQGRDERRPSTVLVVGQFNIGTGVFVRIVVDK